MSVTPLGRCAHGNCSSHAGGMKSTRYSCNAMRRMQNAPDTRLAPNGAEILAALLRKPLQELADVDKHAFVDADPDLLRTVGRVDPEFDVSSVDLGDFRIGRDAAPGGRRRQVANVDASAECAFPHAEIGLDG